MAKQKFTHSFLRIYSFIYSFIFIQLFIFLGIHVVPCDIDGRLIVQGIEPGGKILIFLFSNFLEI